MHQLGEYRLLEQIGDGKMGKVYVAEQGSTGRRVVVKVFRASLTASEEVRKAILGELKVVARLKHPNAVDTLSCEIAGEQMLIAREHLGGHTVKQAIASRGALPWHEAVHVAAQVASALNAAHRFNPPILHQDIKPGNIFLTPDGVKVIDFGIARIFNATKDDSTAQSLGNVQYMSPEEIDGDEVGPASDLYQLGLLLYECLAGYPPFHEGSALQLMTAQATKPPPPLPPQVMGMLPPPLGQLLDRLLSKRPDQRPRSAAEVVASLESLQMAASAPPPGFVPLSGPSLASASPPGHVSVQGQPSPYGQPSGAHPIHAQHYPGSGAHPVQPSGPHPQASWQGGASSMPPAYGVPVGTSAHALTPAPAKPKGISTGLIIGLVFGGFAILGLSAGGVFMMLETKREAGTGDESGAASQGDGDGDGDKGEGKGEDEGEEPVATKEDLGTGAGEGEGGDEGGAAEEGGEPPPAKLDIGPPKVADTPQGGTEMKISSVKTPSDIDAGRLRSAVGNQKRRMDECFAKHEFTPPAHEFVDLRLKIENGLIASVEGTGDRERNPQLDKCLGEALKDTDIGSKPIGGRASVDISLTAIIKRNQRL